MHHQLQDRPALLGLSLPLAVEEEGPPPVAGGEEPGEGHLRRVSYEQLELWWWWVAGSSRLSKASQRRAAYYAGVGAPQLLRE